MCDFFNTFSSIGKNVGAYCMEICVDKKKFIAPISGEVTVQQGQKFTWENSRGHILTFIDDVRTCYTVFDSCSWENAYNNDVGTINTNTAILAVQEYNVCGSASYAGGTCRRIEIIKVANNVYEEKITAEWSAPSCRYGYEDKGGGNCKMTEDYKQQLIEGRIRAAEDIEDNLIPAAEACYNHKSDHIKQCEEVYVKYGDEIYGQDVEEDLEYKKLVPSVEAKETRENHVELNENIENPVSVFKCPSDESGCLESKQAVNNFLKFRRMKLYTVYNWDTNEDFFSCVNINGKSYLRCTTAEALAPNRYLTIGKNFPVNFNSAIGEHEIQIEYNCKEGEEAALDADACIYNVDGCDPGVCVPKNEGGGNSNGGIEVIYRVIDLNDPFPNRNPGDNWSGNESYITNNRGVSSDDVYGLEPLYTIELDPSSIKNIRNDNKDVDYGSFEDLSCTNGEDCESGYLKELVGRGYLSVNSGG